MRCFSDVLKKTLPPDVFGDVLKKVKHRTNDASNDVRRRALTMGESDCLLATVAGPPTVREHFKLTVVGRQADQS